jgi:FixJ family two-component response regulator
LDPWEFQSPQASRPELQSGGLKPISADLALSMATVKTHLHHIFDKTDTHRQAELVRLLLTIIP